MAETSIEWTDATWNPTRGCSRVSPGCDNCYAMRQARRHDWTRVEGNGVAPQRQVNGAYYGLTTIRRGKVDWSGRVCLVPEALELPLRWRKPRRIFVNSMSDLFHEALSDEEIAAVFGVMAAAPHHTFQVLTKRAKRMREWFEWLAEQKLTVDFSPITTLLQAGCDATPEGARRPGVTDELWHAIRERRGWPLPNVWLGVSSEDQPRADERIPHLLETPAAVRFVSAEPLIGPINMFDWLDRTGRKNVPAGELGPIVGGFKRGIDWCIVGGESGHGARPFEVQWARALRDQCSAAGVPYFLKQLGALAKIRTVHDYGRSESWNYLPLLDRKGGAIEEWPPDLRVREFPEVRP